MYVGIIKIELHFKAIFSIKQKRKNIIRVKDKILSKFKVAIAEVGDQDLYNSSILGISFVSNKKNHAVSKVQNIITFLENYESDIFYDHDLLIEEY